MKLISFDVGIKNMAYCILDLSGTNFQIKDWNVLNLMNPVETTNYICNCKVKTKHQSHDFHILKVRHAIQRI